MERPAQWTRGKRASGCKTGRFQHDFVAGVDYYREPNKYKGESIEFFRSIGVHASGCLPPEVRNSFSRQFFFSVYQRARPVHATVGLYLQDRMQTDQTPFF